MTIKILVDDLMEIINKFKVRIGLFALIGFLGMFFISKSALFLFCSSIGMIIIIDGFVENYYSKNLLLGFLGIILLQWLIISYAYVFAPIQSPERNNFYLMMLLSIFFSLTFFYNFTQRSKHIGEKN
ncbi:MAG TPA: hypothetical protein PL168_06835 [Methanobacterium sp.]|nr:hypothetical protein [Methanobacterium sp.]